MKKRYTFACPTLLFFCFLAFGQTAFAQATLSIQGIIQKSNGAAVDDGRYDLTFKLYTTSSGGTAVHSETQNITVAGGIYSAELGSSGTPLTAAFDQTYYLGVSVDGGAELIPRARLTSSPYSLALLGTDNLFPSSGPIGAGTITPTAGYQLHVKKSSGVGKMLVEGSDAGQIDFKKGGTVGTVGFGTANNDFIVNPGANNTTLQHNGTTKLTVNTNGVDVAGTLNATNFTGGFSNLAVTSKLAVGQGSVDANHTLKVEGNSLFNGAIEVTGYKTFSIGQVAYFHVNQTFIAGGQAGSPSISAKFTGTIAAPQFFAYSDRRIKKDFHLSESLADLASLRKLRVTDYRHVDEVANGSAFKKGFVAQEVKETFPEAVTTAPDFIPNVYALSSKTKLSASKLTISLDKNHEFAVGDEVKLILEKGDEKRATVLAVADANTFVVDWTGEAAAEQVFIYGKKVADFHSVDYDRIFTLNVSATQELAREVEELKKENAALKSNLAKKDEQIDGMKASAEKFDARLRALENRISN